jgi:hypothetical protein
METGSTQRHRLLRWGRLSHALGTSPDRPHPRLHHGGSVEIRWCSTWCSDAEQVERLFTLPRLERAWTSRLTSTAAAMAKLAAAREVLARGRTLIWTEDAEVPTTGPVHEELTATGRALLIAPSPTRGLQPDHMEAIKAFIAAPSGEGVDPTSDANSTEDALRIARHLLGGSTTPTQ